MTVAASLKARWDSFFGAGSLRSRFISGAIWILAGTVAAQLVTAIASILVARILGKVGFGELGILRSTQAMFASFAGLGLGLTASKHLAEYRDSDPQRAGRIMGMAYAAATASGLIMTVIAIVFAKPLATHALNGPHLAYYLRLIAPLLLLGTITGVQNGVLTGLEAFRGMSLRMALVSVITAILTVLGAFVDGLDGAVWASLISGILGFVLLQFVVGTECRRAGVSLDCRVSRREITLLWTFALPSMLAGVAVVPATWMANAILVNTPNGYSEMGLFNAANQWRTLLLFLPSIVSAPLLPIMVQLQVGGEWKRLRRLLLRCMAANIVLVGSCAVALALVAKPIMSLYGKGFEVGAPVLLTMLAVAVLLAAGNVVANLIISTGRIWFGALVNIVWGTVLVAAAASLVSRHGALGLAMAYLAAYGVHTAVQLTYFWWHCGKMQHVSPERNCSIQDVPVAGAD